MLAGLAVMEKSKKKREKKKPERIGNITKEPEQKKSHQRFSVSSGLNYLFLRRDEGNSKAYTDRRESVIDKLSQIKQKVKRKF